MTFTWSLTHFHPSYRMQEGSAGAKVWGKRTAFELTAFWPAYPIAMGRDSPPRFLIAPLLPCCGSSARFERGILRCQGCELYLWDEGYPTAFEPRLSFEAEAPMPEALEAQRPAFTEWMDVFDLDPLEMEIELSLLISYLRHEALSMRAWAGGGPVSMKAQGGGDSFMDSMKLAGKAWSLTDE